MLINPAHRPKKRRSAAQKAATRRMLSARRSGSKTRRRRNPIANPIHSAHSLHRRARHHRRRNPASRSSGGIGGMVMPVVQGATGALAVNAIANMLPLPHAMNVGQMRHVTRAGLAIALGIVGRRFLGRAAAKMAEGSLIVEATHAVSEMIGNTMPSLAFHGLGALPDYSGMGAITEEVSQQYYTPESFATERVLSGLGAVPEFV